MRYLLLLCRNAQKLKDVIFLFYILFVVFIFLIIIKWWTKIWKQQIIYKIRIWRGSDAVKDRIINFMIRFFTASDPRQICIPLACGKLQPTFVKSSWSHIVTSLLHYTCSWYGYISGTKAVTATNCALPVIEIVYKLTWTTDF